MTKPEGNSRLRRQVSFSRSSRAVAGPVLRQPVQTGAAVLAEGRQVVAVGADNQRGHAVLLAVAKRVIPAMCGGMFVLSGAAARQVDAMPADQRANF
jgi:hypothetical protein